MITNFYSNVNNGNAVDKCKHTQHFVQDQPYLLKANFLSEFRTALEKAKVRANLGIADSETLFWGNIQGDIAEQKDIAGYIDALLAFDYDAEKDFVATEDFKNVNTVRKAAITCLQYLSKFKGEGAEIAALDDKIKAILLNLYAVDNLDAVDSSEGGVINELVKNVTILQGQLGNPNTTVEEIESKLDAVETNVNDLNDTLANINSLLVKYEPTDGSNNALEIIDDKIITVQVPLLNEDGEPVLDGLGQPILVDKEEVIKGGLYVKDLQPQIDELYNEINGESGKISELQKEITDNSENIASNKSSINAIQGTTIPAIVKEIADIKKNYISKDSLGSNSPIVTDDKLTEKLNNYVKTDSVASLQGITSKNDSIAVDKPFNFTTNNPGDSRRYVEKKEDLLTITNYWPGMEVIVIEDALMYILKKDGDPSDPSYDGWKIADSLKIEVLSREEFEQRQKAGDLNPLVYYYIYSEPVTFREYPNRNDYESDADFEYAVELWKKDAFVLQGQYMSAAWGQDLENHLKYKVDKANFSVLNDKVATIEAFFNSKDGDTLAGLKESIQYIYKPAYEELDNKGNTVQKPASGLLITLSDKVNEIDARVTTLEETGFVKWDDIGAGNEIVTDPELTNRLSNYIAKDSIASIEGLTSKENSIKIDKPFNPESGFPLDERKYVETYQDLYTVNPDTAYVGMEVIVKSEGIIMMLQDLDNITNDDGWKNVGLASIVELTLEEYKLRADNTNEDGTSKGHVYEGTSEPVPTLLGNVYYFIKETPITFKELPKRNGRTDEEWIEDLETWKKDTYLLWHLFLTASWGEDMTNKVNAKADQASFIANKNVTDENREFILDIYKQLEILNACFENVPEAKIENIINAASALKNDFDALSEDFDSAKLDLYGDEDTKPKFVTWKALGGEDEDGLTEGKTLFVKTTVYEADRLADSKEFTTEKLTFPGIQTIHHDAVEEVSHTDEITGEKIIDVEAVEAYDEKINDPLSVTRSYNRIKVGNEEVAFRDDLLKSVEFDSYPIYFEFINGRGTIDGKEDSQTYDEWIEGKDLTQWYFFIKYDGTVLPPRNPDESLEDYEIRIESFKKGMLLTAYDAENIYATQNALQAAADQLSSRIKYEDLRIDRAYKHLNDSIELQNASIAKEKEDLDKNLEEHHQENLSLNKETRDIFKQAWGRFYDPIEDYYTDLGTIIDKSETKLTINIAAFLKKWTTSECERIAARKLEESTFKEVWDTYYTATDGYTPLKDIIAEIIGDSEDGESLSLTSLKNQIDLRETIEDHNNSLEATKTELTNEIHKLRNEAIIMAGDAQRNATEVCLNAVPINYAYLKYLRDTGGLVQGRSYRIIDYKTTSKESNTKVIWHPFDIVVVATSIYELSETAYAVVPDTCRSSLIIGGGGYTPPDPDDNTINTGDENEFVGGLAEDEESEGAMTLDNYYQYCNLSAWELKYTIDNDTSRYSWVDDRYIVIEPFNNYIEGAIILVDDYNQLSDTNKAKCEQIGRGVIYYMKDEFGNECSYDFKSILFERFYIEALTSQKNMSNWIVNNYYSALSSTLENQDTIIPHYKSLNNPGAQTRFYYTFDTGSTFTAEQVLSMAPAIQVHAGDPIELTWYNAINDKNSCRDNHFAYPCNLYNVVQNGTGTTILIDKNRIVLSNNVLIGTNFVSNTCNDQGFAYNTILDGMSFNTFGGNFAFNILATNFTNNKIGYDCKLNIINSEFNYNTIGNKFQKNCINIVCENNIFRELIVNNAFSHHTTENIFGNNIHDCDFPDYFKNNELGGDTVELKIIDSAHYMQFCYFNKGIHQLKILDSANNGLGRSGPNSWYQYINFNWSYFSTLTTIDLSNGDFQGQRNNFNINPGNNYITEIQDSTTPGQGYVWCPADIPKAIRTMWDKIDAMESAMTKLAERVSESERNIKNFETIINNEKEYSDSIAKAVKQLAEYHNTALELERKDVMIIGPKGDLVKIPGAPAEQTN